MDHVRKWRSFQGEWGEPEGGVLAGQLRGSVSCMNERTLPASASR